MSRIEDLLAQLSGKVNPASASRLKSDEHGRPIKICENCGRKNALQDVRCMGCGEILQ
jgi:hypothetical protein